MTLKTYHGSCHCGTVRFECDLDLAEGTSKCNCSICRKTRFWKAIVKADAFRLRQGQAALADYQFGGRTVHHRFCRHCGVKVFGHAEADARGGRFYAVNVACLDDAGADELAAAPVAWQNGRDNAWDEPPAEVWHL